MATGSIESDADWSGEPAPRRGKHRGLWIGVGIGLVALLALTCITGGIGLMFLGLGMVSSDIEAELRDNPVLQEELGTLEAFEMDWPRSMKEAGEDVFVYRARGSKGSGLVRVESVTVEDGEKVVWAELELPSGEKRSLPVTEQAAPPQSGEEAKE